MSCFITSYSSFKSISHLIWYVFVCSYRPVMGICYGQFSGPCNGFTLSWMHHILHKFDFKIECNFVGRTVRPQVFKQQRVLTVGSPTAPGVHPGMKRTVTVEDAGQEPRVVTLLICHPSMKLASSGNTARTSASMRVWHCLYITNNEHTQSWI